MNENKTIQKGLVLIKALMAVAVTASIIASVLFIIRQKTLHTNRIEAQQTLVQAAHNMERYFVFHNSYENAVVSPVQSPRSGKAVYTLAFEGEPNDRAFTVRATPDASGVNRNDGFLEITSTGLRRSEAGHDGWPAP